MKEDMIYLILISIGSLHISGTSSHATFPGTYHAVIHALTGNDSAHHSEQVTFNETNELIHRVLKNFGCEPAGVCSNCTLTARALFRVVETNSSNNILEQSELKRASVVILHVLSKPLSTSCGQALNVSHDAYTRLYAADILEKLNHGGATLTAKIEHLLDDHIKPYYKPDEHEEGESGHEGDEGHDDHKCFNHETLAATVGSSTATTDIDLQTAEEIATSVLLNLLQGNHLEEHCEDLPEKGDFLNDLFQYLSKKNSEIISKHEFEELLKSLKIGLEDDSAHDSETDHDHDHRRKREVGQQQDNAYVRKVRRKRASHVTSLNKTHKCFSPEKLIEIFEVNATHGVTKQNFKEICPALIQQQVKNVCKKDTDVKKKAGEVTDLEKYGYSTLAVAIISLCAALGLLLILCKGKPTLHQYLLVGLTALAVGTLSADAMLHLIPMAMGVHLHSDHDEHGHGASVKVEDYMWRQLVLLGAIYGFFLLEVLLNGIRGNKIQESKSHSQMHLDAIVSKENLEKQAGGDDKSENLTEKPCCGLTTLALLIVLGDAVHNFADGLAIGASFSSSTKEGLSTSIAVLCHELPHELGDFAVLLSTGLSYKAAVMLNVFSAFTAFAGAFIGIAVSVNVAVRQWIFAVTAGMFLYVALVDMLPELVHHKSKSQTKHFILVSVGMILGTLILFLLAIFEHMI